MAWTEPLRIREFRWLFAAVLSAASGMFATVLVAEGAAYDLSGHSPFWSSLPYTAVLVPGLFAAPIVGGLVDKLNRPRVMVGSACVSAAAGILLAVLWASGARGLGALTACCLVVGVGQSSLTPAWQALVPAMLGSKALLGGGGLTRIASQGGEFAGPAVLAWLLAVHVPTAVGFAICGGFYALAAACAAPLLRTRALHGTATTGVGVLRLISGGIRYVGRTPPVRLVMLLTGCHCALTMAFMGLLPGKASEIGHPALYGAMMTTVGLGAIAGCLVLTVLAPRVDGTRVLLGSALASGLTLAWLGMPGGAASVLAACLASGASQAVFMAASYTLLQLAVGNHLRGRIASLSNMLNSGSMSLVSLAWGALAAAISASAVLVGTGVAFVPLVVAAALLYPPLRQRGGIGASAVGAGP